MSLRNFFKRYIPHQEHIKKQGYIHILSAHLHDPNIWHLHRRSSAGGAAVGMFCSFIPFPVQTISSAALAILFRVNLPVAIVFSLFSNPITIPPVFFFAYKIGATIMDTELRQIEFVFNAGWLSNILLQIWQPLLLGCFILATASSIITYWVIRLIWRISAINKWEKRRKKQRPC